MRKKEILTVLLCITLTIGIIGFVIMSGNQKHHDLLGGKTVKGIAMHDDTNERELHNSELAQEIHKLRIDLEHKSFGVDGKRKTNEEIEQLELDAIEAAALEEELEEVEEVEKAPEVPVVETEPRTETGTDSGGWNSPTKKSTNIKNPVSDEKIKTDTEKERQKRAAEIKRKEREAKELKEIEEARAKEEAKAKEEEENKRKEEEEKAEEKEEKESEKEKEEENKKDPELDPDAEDI